MLDLVREYAGEQVVVTGAAGFIGSHLVERLVELGARVRALDRVALDECANLASVRGRMSYHRGALVAGAELDDAVRGCRYVFHLAGNANVALSAEQPRMDFEANVVATFNVLDAVRRTGAGTLFFASSASVYGEPQRVPMDEQHPLCPKSPYAGHKLAAEMLIDAHMRCFDLDARRVRLFSTFGPRQNKYVMFDLLEKLRRDPRRLEVLGTGEQIRTYSFVADTVDAFLLVAAHPDARSGVYNVGGERPISIRELVGLIVAATGLPPPVISYTGESWPGDVVRLYGDSRRLLELGFAPRCGLEEGIRRLVAWHRHEHAPPW